MKKIRAAPSASSEKQVSYFKTVHALFSSFSWCSFTHSLTHSLNVVSDIFFQQTGVIETREQRSKSASEVDLSVVVSVSKAWSLPITQTVFWLVMKSSPTRGKNALSNAKNVCVGCYLACYLFSFSLSLFSLTRKVVTLHYLPVYTLVPSPKCMPFLLTK